MRSVALLIAIGLLSAGCYSPFYESFDPDSASAQEEEPAFQRVGQGVHAWPIVEIEEEEDRSRTDLLWPLIQKIKRPDGWFFRALPVLVLRRFDDRDSTWVFPLYGHNQTADSEDTYVAYPLFYSGVNPDEKEFHALLYYSAEDSEGKESVVFPVYWGYNGTQKRYNWFLPIYGRYFNKRKDSVLTAITPLFWNYKDPDERTSVLFPVLWAHKDEYMSYLWVFPLYGHAKDDHSRLTSVATPIFWHEIDRDSWKFVVFPFVWLYQAPEEHWRHLFPLAADWKTYNSRGWYFAFPFFIYGKDRHGGKDTDEWLYTGPFPFVMIERSENRDSTMVFPLYAKEVTRRTDRDTQELIVKSQTILGLGTVLSETQGDKREVLGLFGLIFDYLRVGEKKTFKMFLDLWKFVRDEPENYSFSSAIAFYRNEVKNDEGKGWMLWPLASWEKSGEDRSELDILVWLIRKSVDPAISSFSFNPFYFHEKNSAGDLHWSVLFHMLSRTREQDYVTWRVLWLFEF